jgi:hypothetical protein
MELCRLRQIGYGDVRTTALLGAAHLETSKVIRIDKEYFANDPSGSVEELIHAEAVRLDAYLRSGARASFPFWQETQTGHER